MIKFLIVPANQPAAILKRVPCALTLVATVNMPSGDLHPRITNSHTHTLNPPQSVHAILEPCAWPQAGPLTQQTNYTGCCNGPLATIETLDRH